MADRFELEATWSRTLRIWWALVWREFVAALVAVIGGAVLGFIVGFILGILGIPVSLIKVVTGSIGGALGLAISVVPVKLIIGRDFGGFRLVLLTSSSVTPPITSANVLGSQ